MNKLNTAMILGACMLLAAAGCSKHKKDGEGDKPADTAGGTAAPAGGATPTDTATPAPAAASTIRIDGSSTVFPISQAVAEEFQSKSDAKVTIGESGTGGGFKKFCRGEIDIADASRPIKPTEVEDCKKAGIEYIELPIAYDGLAIVVNPKADWVDKITVDELKKMWEPAAQGTVTKWSQIRKGWPDKPLRLFGPGVDSGTYDYFTKAIVGEEHKSRGDYTSSEDDNTLVQGVASDVSGLGFFGLAYFTENKDRLKLVPVDDGKKENGDGAILPSETTVNDGTYQPLSRPIFIYVSTKAADRAEIVKFVEAYLAGKALVKEVGYVPLPDKAYELASKRFAARKTGSLFLGEGSMVGVTIEQLLSKEGT